jgi:tetraacyldisaccharide 4'-kinase
MPGLAGQSLRETLLAAWAHRGWLACALLPLSLLYGVLLRVRRFLYAGGYLATSRVDSVVIVVGNAIVGGAGKTPTVINIVERLKVRGLLVGVVSAGFGGKFQHCVEVKADSTALEVGDEPTLIKFRCNVPVFVGKSRSAAANALLGRYPETQVIICDDGLQHYALSRDIEVCVFDDRRTGNGWLLPAGPLRESWPRPAGMQPWLVGASAPMELHTDGHSSGCGYRATRGLSGLASQRNGDTVSLESLGRSTAKPLFAIAGIARPEVFFSMLRTMGMNLQGTLALADHFDFKKFEASGFAQFQIICTEKDAVKLWDHVPDALAVRLIQEPEPAFFSALETEVMNHLNARISSRYGHKTSGTAGMPGHQGPA